MPEIIIYHHDPVEVDPATSWTGLCPSLKRAHRINVRLATNPRVKDLFDYARPDAVITVDGVPCVSIEQTRMNPSGHNIPQRFSCLVRASELGVSSILYYPEFSRRTFSDPNVRYLQVRVPLAQLRLSRIYNIPSLSVFWPTNPHNKLPEINRDAHQEIANIVEAIIQNFKSKNLFEVPEILSAIAKMDEVIQKYANRYRTNSSVRNILPSGFDSSLILLQSESNFIQEDQANYRPSSVSIDPPEVAQLIQTDIFLDNLASKTNQDGGWREVQKYFRKRPYTLLFKGTANKDKNDSEHPWPGYITLLDILYLRSEQGVTPLDRTSNLAYSLPVKASIFISRVNQTSPPTPSYIIDTFADLIILNGGVIAGRPIRGNKRAAAL